MSRYTAEEMAEIRSEAARCQLDGNALFWGASNDQLTKICNGIGAEDAPEWVRDALTWIYREYQASAAIHDCDYDVSNGDEQDREVADNRFKENCLREWVDCFGSFRWVRPRGLWERNKIRLAYNALRLWGADAWQEAYKKRREAKA